jgi:aerobic-type carbon monoxide dehydrogenase small subunit (CoxS/CutS family)
MLLKSVFTAGELVVAVEIWECHRLMSEDDVYEDYNGQLCRSGNYWRTLYMTKVACPNTGFYWVYSHNLERYSEK